MEWKLLLFTTVVCILSAPVTNGSPCGVDCQAAAQAHNECCMYENCFTEFLFEPCCSLLGMCKYRYYVSQRRVVTIGLVI